MIPVHDLYITKRRVHTEPRVRRREDETLDLCTRITAKGLRDGRYLQRTAYFTNGMVFRMLVTVLRALEICGGCGSGFSEASTVGCIACWG
jgi:hypothetical protein